MFFAILAFYGCGESQHSRLMQMQDAGYYFSDTGTLNRSLWHSSNGRQEEIVERVIIDIDYFYPHITLFRQVSVTEVCEPGKIGSEVRDEFE